MENKFVPDRTIEFHAYAAEEVLNPFKWMLVCLCHDVCFFCCVLTCLQAGLLGSQAIASAYQKAGKVVAGMVQLGERQLAFQFVWPSLCKCSYLNLIWQIWWAMSHLEQNHVSVC